MSHNLYNSDLKLLIVICKKNLDCADGLAVGIDCANGGRRHSSAMITNEYFFKKNCADGLAVSIGCADGGRRHSSAYADGNHVPTVF
jgi:hypothetical protein